MAMVKCNECGNQVSTEAKKCPSCGAPTKKKMGVMKMLGLGFGVLLLVGMCSVALSNKDAEAQGEKSTDVATGEQPSGADKAPTPSAKSNLGDYLEFGKPTLKHLMGDMSQVLVEVQNKGDSGITCTVTATFKKGDEILGTANGAVNDIPAKGKKTAQLMAADKVDGFETVKLETSACFASSAKATAAGAGTRSGDPLKFGKPTIKKLMGDMSQVMVEVTNTTDKKLSCTVTATFKKGDEILETATGAVNEVPPEGTKTAQLMSSGALGDYDDVILEASTCF